jgi:hypothetical protein
MANDIFYKPQSFPIDPREHDSGRCFRLFSDFNNANHDFSVLKTTPSGSAFADPIFNVQYLTNPVVASTCSVVTASGLVQDSAIEIRDRQTTTATGSLRLGVVETDFAWRGKWDRNALTRGLVRIGFYDDILTANATGIDGKNAVCFFANAASDTWTIGIYRGWTGTASPTSYKFTKTLTTPCNAFASLAIYIDAAASSAVFTVDGLVVHRQKGDLPTALTMASGDSFQAGLSLQCNATHNGIQTLESDYMLFRYFHDRKK